MLGYGRHAIIISVFRGDAASNLDCTAFDKKYDAIPTDVSDHAASLMLDLWLVGALMEHCQSRPWNVACEEYNLSWHDIKWSLSNLTGNGSRPIEESAWAVFLSG